MLMHVNPNAISCRDIERFLYDYVEQELDQRLLVAFDNHVLTCADCQTSVASYKRSNEVVRRHVARDVRIPSALRESLLRQLIESA